MAKHVLPKTTPRFTSLLVATIITYFASLLLSSPAYAAVSFTGDVPTDYAGVDTFIIDDPVGDVGMPAALAGSTSGWDIDGVYLHYDYTNDTLYVGIDCIGICGDADGDGDPGVSSAALIGAGGIDFIDLGSSESFILLIDTNNDFNGTTGFDIVTGIHSDGSTIANFGIFNFVHNTTPWSASANFGAALPNTATLHANPSSTDPDIEFSIANISTLPGTDFIPGEAFTFGAYYFNGSLDDDGVGEDSVPGSLQSETFQFAGLASIGDYVWYDANANGIQDASETIGFEGVTVQLFSSVGVLIDTTTTNSSGYFNFTLIPPGDYYLIFSNLPEEYTISPQDQGGSNALDSDVNPSTRRTTTTNLVIGENDVTWDMGLYGANAPGLAETGYSIVPWIILGIILGISLGISLGLTTILHSTYLYISRSRFL